MSRGIGKEFSFCLMPPKQHVLLSLNPLLWIVVVGRSIASKWRLLFNTCSCWSFWRCDIGRGAAVMLLPTYVQMQPHKSTTTTLEANTWMTLNCILANCLYCPSGQRLDKDRKWHQLLLLADASFFGFILKHAKDFLSHLVCGKQWYHAYSCKLHLWVVFTKVKHVFSFVLNNWGTYRVSR